MNELDRLIQLLSKLRISRVLLTGCVAFDPKAHQFDGTDCRITDKVLETIQTCSICGNLTLRIHAGFVAMKAAMIV